MRTAFLLLMFMAWNYTGHAQGEIQDGLYKIYQGNVIKNLATCKKIELNGVAFQYYKNGDIQRQSWYQNNQLHGATKIFSADNNKLVEIKVYDQGHLTGAKTYTGAGEPSQ